MNRRMRLGVGARPQYRHVQIPEPALVLECAAFESAGHDRLGLVEARLRLVVVDAETLIVVDVVGAAAAQPDDQPTLGQVVEHRDLLGEAHRVVQRGLDHREAERGALQRDCQRAGERDRVGIGADAVEMVLAEPDHVGAELVRQHRLAQVSPMTAPSRSGSRLSGNRKLPNFMAVPLPVRRCV